jgi:RNA polymerase sigma factor (sigma-70 family)
MNSRNIDLNLLEAARAGQPAAISAVLAAAQPDIRRYAFRSCAFTDDVDDAVQESLWILYRRIGVIQALTSFSGWLLQVVRRECSRLARRALNLGKSIDVEDQSLEAHLAVRNTHDLQLDLAAAIQSLPPHYREIVLLRDVEEQTIDEIAATLALTRESAKARLHRARKLIREYMQD